MALIPLKQTVTIKPATGETDRFNRPVYGQPYSLKCRFQEGTKLVRSRSGGFTTNAEAVSSAQIYLAGYVAIHMDDEISFTDEGGITQTYTPINVSVKRGLSSKALLTVVYV